MKYDYSFAKAGDSLCICENGTVLIENITGYMKHKGTAYNVVTVPRKGEWNVNGDSASCDNMMIEMTPCREGFLVRSTFTNIEEDLTVPCEFTAFAGRLMKTIRRGIVNQYSRFNGNAVCEMESQIDTVCTVFNAVYDSAENTVFDTTDGEAFVFGQATYEKYFSGVTFSRDGFITAHASTEWHTIKTGGSVTSEWFFFSREQDCVNGLLSYAQTVAAIAGAEKSKKTNPSGFCTWYYYASGVTPDIVRQNMAVLDAHREDIPVRYIQIDDGWFDEWGSWENNGKFKDIKALADEIKAHGYLPGIWIAPFGCAKDGKLMKEHPEYFVKDSEGNLWQGLSLDYTRPEVREYMAKIVRKLTCDWGFKYIKMDIISPTICPGVHYDPDATALSNYRTGLRLIRENVPDDVFLLACTAPLGGACGLVDGMRVSCDVFERWESLIDVFNAVLKRYYYHRNYYLIDADCLIIRKKENEDSECFRLCTRTDNEIRTYVTAMAASGGILMLSDKLPNLREEQFRLISRLFPANQECALPLDMMESYVPGVLDFGKHGHARTVAMINWGEAPRTLSVENGESLVWEFWDKEFLLHKGGSFSAEIAPRTAKVYYFTDPADMAVIGSDASVMMQTEWDIADGVISARKLKKDEKVYVASAHAIQAGQGTAVKLTENGQYTVYEVSPVTDEYTIR